MRRLLLILLLLWLVGIIVGLTRPEAFFVVLGLGLFCLVLWGVRLQLLVASIALLSLGVVLGNTSTSYLAAEEARCRDVERPLLGTIAKTPVIKITGVDYQVEDDSRCHYLVSGLVDPVYTQGDVVSISGSWQPVGEIGQKNPGYADYLRRKGIWAQARYPTIEVVRSGVQAPVSTLHAYIRKRIQLVLPEPESSLALGMVFNEAGTIAPAVIDDFRTTGLSHVLAISGSNISLLAAIIFALSFLVPVSGKTRSLVISLLLWVYVAFIGWPVSALRAVFFWTLALFGFQMRALVGFGGVSMATAVVMITANPLIFFDVGFQLSLAAVMGIMVWLLVLGPYFYHSKYPTLFQALAVMGGATFFTWPLTIYHFGTLSLVGLLANIIILPFLSLFYILLLVVVACSFLVPPLSMPIAFGVHALWRVTYSLTQLLAAQTWAYFEDLRLPLWAVALWYGVFILLATWMLAKQKRTWREIWI